MCLLVGVVFTANRRLALLVASQYLRTGLSQLSEHTMASECWSLSDSSDAEMAPLSSSIAVAEPDSKRMKTEGPSRPVRSPAPATCSEELGSTTWVQRLTSILNLADFVKKFESPLVLQTGCSGTNAVSIALKECVQCRQRPPLPQQSGNRRVMGWSTDGQRNCKVFSTLQM